MLTIDLPADVEERLGSLAKRIGHSKSLCAQLAIVAYIDDLEEALCAEAEVDNGGKVWTHEEVAQELDLDR